MKVAERHMVFHHPLPLAHKPQAGSEVRPIRMVEAFKKLGFTVELVTGYARERRAAIRRIQRQVREGRRFDFVYSESTSMPTAMTEPHHLPLHPLLDFGFLNWMRRHGVATGWFYRDVYWRFDLYRQAVPLAKRLPAVAFYWYEWLQARRSVDHLFLPSVEMIRVLPRGWPEHKVSALPPGCEIFDGERRDARTDPTRLEVLYVGGIRPPLYDLTPLVDAVHRAGHARLTLVCRPDEWRALAGYYDRGNAHELRVVHAGGTELHSLYAQADVFAIVRKTHAYLEFAMPVKLFEALGHGVPVVTTGGTAVARFVAGEKIGWVVTDERELVNLFDSLVVNRDALVAMRERVRRVRHRHTWTDRARQVAATLTGEQ